MSDLISSINWKDFVTVVERGKVSELQSCEVLRPEHDFTVIIFHGDRFTTDYARTQAEYLAQRTNSVSGKTPSELMAEIEEEICQSLNLNVKTDAGPLKSTKSTTKSRKSGVRRVKAKRKGSGRKSTGVLVGATTPTLT